MVNFQWGLLQIDHVYIDLVMHTCFLPTTAAWRSAWMQNAIASLNDNFCKWPWYKWNVKRWVLLQDKWSQGALSDQEIHMWLDSLNERIRKSFLTYLSIVAIVVLDSMPFHGIRDSSVYMAKFETITTSTRLGWSGTHIWRSLNVIYAELFLVFRSRPLGIWLMIIFLDNLWKLLSYGAGYGAGYFCIS